MQSHCLACGAKFWSILCKCDVCKSKLVIDITDITYSSKWQQACVWLILLGFIYCLCTQNNVIVSVFLIATAFGWKYIVVPIGEWQKARFARGFCERLLERYSKLHKQKDWHWPSNTPDFLKKHVLAFCADLQKPISCKKYNRVAVLAPTREMVWERQFGNKVHGICPVCYKTPISCLQFECGHITALAKGGANAIENYLPICSRCNRSMGTENLYAFQKRILA
jgi:hypothetical protein